jgi:peptidoglycan/LPS O-acetylase OafA/YrhL
MSRSDSGPAASSPTFADAFDPKRNAFAFLRMVLALLVIVSHSFALGGFGPDPLRRITEGRHNLGEIAVALFFLLSGFLITRSGLRSRSVGRFLWHRFLRIFPGYWVCLLVTAFLFSPLFEMIKHGVFTADASLAYVRGNWAMFHLNGFSIPGIMNLRPSTIGWALNDNPHPWSINGSLWSLPYECACYLVLALFACAGVLRRGRVGIVILFGGLWALYAFSYLDTEYFHECFPDRGFLPLLFLTLYFSAGCVCYLYRESIPASKTLFAACIVLLAVGLAFDSFGLVAPIAMSYASMCLAFWLPIRRFDAFGDFSYGVYIYAFPVQQGLVLLRVPQNGLALFLVSSVLITLVLALLSYRFIEAPSLRWKDVKLARSTNFPRQRPKNGGPELALALVPEPAD